MRLPGLLLAAALCLAPAAASADMCFGGGQRPTPDPQDLAQPPSNDLSQPTDGGMLGFGRGKARRVGGGLVLAASAGSLWLVLRRRSSSRRADDAR